MALQLHDFTKRYGKRELLRNVTIGFPEQGRVFLMGKNGSGKTTLVKCICGLETFGGTITGAGRVTVVWDDTPFYEAISGLRNLRIFCEEACSTKELREIAARMLPAEILKRPVRTYSCGQRKKLALVLAQLLPGETLILDEISNGLDYPSALEIKEKISEWSTDRCVILTGHQYGFYDDPDQQVLVIKDCGLICRAGRLETIYEHELLET